MSTLTQNSTIVRVGAGVGLAALAGLAAYGLLTHTRHGRRLTRECLMRLLNSMPEPFPKSLPFAQRVQPHGPLEQLDDGLWVVRGSLPNIPIPRYMTIYRPPNSTSLLVFSMLCVDAKTLAEVRKLGTVTHMVIPCSWHTLDAAVYRNEFPNAKLIAPRAALHQLSKKVDVEVLAAEDVFPLWNENPEAASTTQGAGTMECSVQLIYGKGCSAEFDECELLLALPPRTSTAASVSETTNLIQRKPATTDSRHALIINDMFHEDLKFTRISWFLVIDHLARFRKWLHEFMAKVVVGENVDVVIVSHGQPVVGKEQIRRKMKASLSAI
ncbi:uncharacterized protein EV422DRAFT_570438 [Fimicolochytrium jonesii]|uniref:uncharacterized protein n=1 Tax=Fimicolochytrium jonesii TaxID=1396493 RepID=UPI0022FF1B86|nr:uncharacterized protein EV422DRAFT_570438 [Fimicolochytrium jonesii]KAI8817670.1 hypothetical protein EV422DRAFT_570438 [Fimicolochytrium jonesii]